MKQVELQFAFGYIQSNGVETVVKQIQFYFIRLKSKLIYFKCICIFEYKQFFY